MGLRSTEGDTPELGVLLIQPGQLPEDTLSLLFFRCLCACWLHPLGLSCMLGSLITSAQLPLNRIPVAGRRREMLGWLLAIPILLQKCVTLLVIARASTASRQHWGGWPWR